jgi:hypothetical protein
MTNLEDYLTAARQHGADEDPDHEVGDLQDLLRAAWSLMSPEQRSALMRSDPVLNLVELAT